MRIPVLALLLLLPLTATAQVQITPPSSTTPSATAAVQDPAARQAEQQEYIALDKFHAHNLTLPSAKAGAEADLRGVFSNPTATPLTITNITTDATPQVVFLQPQADPATGFSGLAPTPTLVLPLHGTLTVTVGATGKQVSNQLGVRLLGLTKALEAGMEVPLTLHFAHGNSRTYRAIILN